MNVNDAEFTPFCIGSHQIKYTISQHGIVDKSFSPLPPFTSTSLYLRNPVLKVHCKVFNGAWIQENVPKLDEASIVPSQIVKMTTHTTFLTLLLIFQPGLA